MRIFGLNITKRSKEPAQDQYNINDPVATSLIFSGYKLENACTSLSAFYAALELISNSMAQLPIVVKRDNEVDKNHPINLLFKDMLITKYMFMKMMISDVILYGDAFAYIDRAKDGTPINLVYCEHGNVTIKYNQRTQEIFYQIPFIRRGNIEAINVIHLYKDSNNGIQGRGIVTYANQVIKLA
jgi:HK97 family phage portal protein